MAAALALSSKPKADRGGTSRRDGLLSVVELRFSWTLLVTLHALCAAFLVSCARLYWFMEHPFIAYYANLLVPQEGRYFRLYGATLGLLGGLHAVQLTMHVCASIRARRLVVWRAAHAADRLMKYWCRAKVQPSQTRSRTSSTSRLASTVYILQASLGVESEHFALMFMLRKAVEVTAQAVQCYRYSVLIARAWINHAYVGMVVTNCWATPLLYRVMHKSDREWAADQVRQAARKDSSVLFAPRSSVVVEVKPRSIRERTLSLSVDALLTAFSCLILPVTIFEPYARQFDDQEFTFPTELLYSDTAFPNLILENRAIFAVSTFDGLTKLVPHVSVLLGLMSISMLLEQQPAATAGRAKSPTNPQPPRTLQLVQTNANASSSKPLHSSLREIAAPLSFLIMGTAILVLHLHAHHIVGKAGVDPMAMCMQPIWPWFASNVSCSVLQYNCYRQGVRSPPQHALDRLDADSVAALIFQHCGAFEMPASVQRFRNLLGLELWNVTLERWDDDAALTATLHPDLVFLVLAYVNLTELPVGFLQRPAPARLADIEISHTNLSTVPADLAESWTGVELVYLEHSPSLLRFPAVLFALPAMSELSLIGNGFQSLPSDLFTSSDTDFYKLALSHNPLASLPQAARDDLSIDWLLLEATELEALPDWTRSRVLEGLPLGGAPVCGGAAVELPAVADCSETPELDEGLYPLSIVAPMRGL